MGPRCGPGDTCCCRSIAGADVILKQLPGIRELCLAFLQLDP
jgi:hypothetical protein